VRPDGAGHVLVQRDQAGAVVGVELRRALRQRLLRQGQAAGDGGETPQLIAISVLKVRSGAIKFIISRGTLLNSINVSVFVFIPKIKKPIR
jgi:hypothetical protein